MPILLDPTTLRTDNDEVLSYRVNLMPAHYDLKIVASEGYEISADEGETYAPEVRVRPSAIFQLAAGIGKHPNRIENNKRTHPFGRVLLNCFFLSFRNWGFSG